jgi:hypothetical protein
MLTDYLQRGTWGRDTVPDAQVVAPVDVPGVEAYLTAKQVELEHLLESFPEVWRQLKEDEFSRMVAEAVVGL